MSRLISFLIVCLCFYIFYRTYWIWYLNQMRRKGQFPLKGKATLFDVKDFLKRGETEMAIRVYMEIYGKSYRVAKLQVEQMKESLK